MESKSVYNAETLYNLSIKAVALSSRQRKFEEYRNLPDNLLFDLYTKLHKEKWLCLLKFELCQIDIFARLMKIPDKRVQLFQTFQSLMDHTNGFLSKDLIFSYNKSCEGVVPTDQQYETIIDTGIRLGGFLSDSGWYSESAVILKRVEDLCQAGIHLPFVEHKLIDCYHRLLHAQAVYCDFPAANKTYNSAIKLIDKLTKENNSPNISGLYSEFSVLYYVQSEYDLAYNWSVKALEKVSENLPPGVIVDIFRQAAKSCVVKRKFKKAGLLIKQAVAYAQEVFQEMHPKHADVLMDYGFYLLNFDSYVKSAKIYKHALKIRSSIFDRNNLNVAIAFEDLAYALYVSEYSSGRFHKARKNVEVAINVMEPLLPKDHLMLASAKRVKALILEEIALDTPPARIYSTYNFYDKTELLKQSEELHLAALRLSLNAFGEKNVQTAKLYGNLGRLYQSMKEYPKAEQMHLRAIAIKEELLGEEDYEVGLSIGHLASLYNYHMEKYREAERLYKRSIAISLKLFGEGYSGLEYDYRGLAHVYREINCFDDMITYTTILGNWKHLREKLTQNDPDEQIESSQPIHHVVKSFFNCS